MKRNAFVTWLLLACATSGYAQSAGNPADELLTYFCTDLGEHLSAYGKLDALDQATRRAERYYERLPAGMQTRETQAAHALAMAGIGTISGWMLSEKSGDFALGEPGARARLEGALKMVTDLETGGPLTPFMRVSSAAVSYTMARHLFREHRYAETVASLERGEQVLSPALNDPTWGKPARQLMVKLLVFRGSGFFRTTPAAAAAVLPFFERAIEYAEADEATLPPGTPRGLSPALVKPAYASALFTAGQADKARQINSACRTRLREIVQSDPFLVSARVGLASSAHYAAVFARADWDFAAWESALRETELHAGVLLKHDPKTWSYGTTLARALAYGGESRCVFEVLRGDLKAAKAAAEKAVACWEVDWIPVGSHSLPRTGRAVLAWFCAATGDDAGATRNLELASAHLERDFAVRPWLTAAERQTLWVSEQSDRREVEFERLNWAAMRANAEAVLARIPDQRRAHRDLMIAAFEMGDYELARRELDAWPWDEKPLPSDANIQRRYDRLGNMLTRIHVRARAGESELALVDLKTLWPEVEAVFAAGPEYLFNQVRMARALALRAEVDGDSAAKRQWLERAAGYLRPAAAAGELTRHAREVVLAGIEKQLGAAPVAVVSGTP